MKVNVPIRFGPVRFLFVLTIALGASHVSLALPNTANGVGGSTIVITDKGAVRGIETVSTREFKGIPYAAAPVGDLRWALPQARKPWHGTLDATRFGSGCPQVARYNLTEAGYDEDCLFLNVTVPKTAVPQNLSVLVWIYGGAFVGGSSSLYPLDALATKGHVIVVTMNYRLGVLGFMAHPAFTRSTDGGYGLADQRAALSWVQRNIAAFGGNPHNVTIAGESAGAASVCMQMLAPGEAKGLFAKAIIQSAGCVQHLRTLDQSDVIGLKVAAIVGCTDRASSLRCMRGKNVKALVDAAAKVAGSDVMTFAPSVGTKAIPLQGTEAMSSGRFIKVPMINGGDENELRLYVAYAAMAGKHVTAANYPTSLRAVYGENTPLVLAEYPLGHFSSPASALGSVMSDFTPDNGLNNCLYLQTANLASRYVTVFEYEFADANAPPVTANPGFEMGAVHSSELPYLFPHFSNTSKVDGPALTPEAQVLSDAMIDYWTEFARTGVPEASGQITWTPYENSARVLRLDQGSIHYFDAGAAHHCAFWKKLYPSLLGN
ncbi:MAG TPA: carboxylesterase family protein [Candidatus Acidoferrum sp.]|nr:carboxylesterase family protein [Candidatus Acidoferrum sp.]